MSLPAALQCGGRAHVYLTSHPACPPGVPTVPPVPAQSWVTARVARGGAAGTAGRGERADPPAASNMTGMFRLPGSGSRECMGRWTQMDLSHGAFVQAATA